MAGEKSGNNENKHEKNEKCKGKYAKYNANHALIKSEMYKIYKKMCSI